MFVKSPIRIMDLVVPKMTFLEDSRLTDQVFTRLAMRDGIKARTMKIRIMTISFESQWVGDMSPASMNQ